MLTGSCHCGAVSWTIDDIPGAAVACNCTICSRYGVIWGYGIVGDTVHLKGETNSYLRADQGAIEFHACPTCLCVTHYVSTAPLEGATDRFRAAVNLRMCDPNDVAGIPVKHFEGRHTWTTLPEDGRTIEDMWY